MSDFSDLISSMGPGTIYYDQRSAQLDRQKQVAYYQSLHTQGSNNSNIVGVMSDILTAGDSYLKKGSKETNWLTIGGNGSGDSWL